MPTYEYECENGHVFEEFQSIVSAPLDVCPICNGSAQRRISGGTGLIFKGSGFYLTDYARKNASPSGTPASTEAKPSGESKPVSSGDTSTTKKSDDGSA